MQKKYKILIVEDDQCLELIIKKTLSSMGYEVDVHWLQSAEQAIQFLDILKQQMGAVNVDLVLSDIFTPGNSNGIDLAKYIQTKLPNLPIVMMSSMNATEYLSQMKNTAEQIPPFLSKPFRPKDMKQTLEGMLLKQEGVAC